MEQISSKTTSLLMLKDVCLNAIFKLLELEDYVNLAKTCSRLLCVARQYKKYKKIKVVKVVKSIDGSSNTVEEFSNILSVIGEHISSVYVYNFPDILDKIADNCTNLSSVELIRCRRPLPFRNLKELKVWNDRSIDYWEIFFASNPGIENLEFHQAVDVKCMALLKMLPTLKSLLIGYVELNPGEFRHLSCLTSLTKFSFKCRTSNNQLLIELAEKLNLVELEFDMPSDADTFAILKYFRNLEVLRIRSHSTIRVPESTIFPSMLKQIKLDNVDISCSVFLSTVKQLKLLDVFDNGYGEIFCDNDESKTFPSKPPVDSEMYPSKQPVVDIIGDINGSKIISRIGKALQEEQRNVKMIFWTSFSMYNQVCKYTDNLEIIINCQHVERAFDQIINVK